MRVAVCDDNGKDTETICHVLRQHLEENGYLGQIATFTNGEALLEAFAAQPFDAVFLDIYMEGLSGIQTAEKLRALNPELALVLITNSQDHALDAYALGVNAYVVKPITSGNMGVAFAKCRQVFNKNGRFISVICSRNKVNIPINTILRVEAQGRITVFHTAAGVFQTSTPLLLEELCQTLGKTFLRCHRSHIVNLNQVVELQPNCFVLRDGGTAPLRQRNRGELRQAYGDYLSDKLFEGDL